MKKISFIGMLLVGGCFHAQVSVFAALRSDDRSVVEGFIAANPKHPKVPELQNKLKTMGYTKPSNATRNEEAQPTLSRMTPQKVEANIGSSRTSESAQKTAAIVTNLLNDNKFSKEAILQIVNRSDCELIIKVSNKSKFYNLSIPAKNQNQILVDKGNYNLTTSICGASYQTNKAINASTIITLGNK